MIGNHTLEGPTMETMTGGGSTGVRSTRGMCFFLSSLSAALKIVHGNSKQKKATPTRKYFLCFKFSASSPLSISVSQVMEELSPYQSFDDDQIWRNNFFGANGIPADGATCLYSRTEGERFSINATTFLASFFLHFPTNLVHWKQLWKMKKF